jgi:hypothetical protein
MHSASISAGDRNSSPPGSHAWQSRSAPNQSRQRCLIRSVSPRSNRSAHSSERISAKAVVEVRADADRIGQDLQIVAQPLGEGAGERLERPAPALLVSACLEVETKQPPPAIGPLEAPARGPIEIGELGCDLVGREGRVRELGDRVARV